jgi:hypothetical protein
MALVQSLGKSKNSGHFHAVREAIGTPMNFDPNCVYCPGSHGVSGEIAHRMRQQRAVSAVHITRFAVSGGAPNASAGQ